MKSFLTLVAVLVVFASEAQESEVKTPQIAIKLSAGELADLGMFSVKFIEVTQDSRCPRGVTCVWAGQVKALVEITEKGKPPMQREVIIGPKRNNEENTRILYKDGEYYAEVKAITPYPEQGQPIGPYNLLLCEYNKPD